ncbi:MAG: GGDEF domain-containing protein [Solirubrobacteraceae bacterium]
MEPSRTAIRHNRRLMAYTAAAMYGAAALDGAIEGFLPGDPKFAIAPVVAVVIVLAGLLAVGPRLPRQALALLGPLGVGLVAVAVATTSGAGDGAVLYALPVLWTAFFFGRRGAIGILACVGVAQAIALLALPAASSYPGRWLDVMVSTTAIALVVLALEHRNELLNLRLAAEARTDPLTGLLNRRGFEERAAVELARARRDPSPVALAIFDIDYFKQVNDDWGHEVGDQVLVRIGHLIAHEARDVDVIARLGGEEFAAMLPGCDTSSGQRFAQRVHQALAAEESPGLPNVQMSTGIFAAVSPPELQMMLRGADDAMYQAKRTGRNRMVVTDAAQTPLQAIGRRRGTVGG